MEKYRRPAFLACLGLSALLCSGCASVQKDAGFGKVRDLVSDRTGHVIEWSSDNLSAERVRITSARLTENELTAEAAVQLALLNNRRLQASLQRLGIAQADLVEAGLLENPVLTAGVLFQDAGTEVDLDVVQNFLGVFTISARSRLGKLAAERVAFEVAAEVTDLAVKVKGQYYKVVGDAQSLALARKVVTGAEAAAEIAQRQYAAGNLSKREQVMQQSFYAQTALEVAQADAQLQSDREALTRLMGLWGLQADWKVPDRLPRIPDALPDLENIEAVAISNRMDLAAAKVELDAINQNLALARQTRWLGPLGIGVQFRRDPGGETSYGPKVELGLPFFDRGQARIARLESQLRESEEILAAMSTDIRSEARAGRARLLAAREVARLYERELVPLQNAIVSETLKFYNGMLVGVYELLLSSREQIRTGRQYIDANRDFWTALAELERAVGRRISLDEYPPGSTGDPDGESQEAPARDNHHHHHHGEHMS